MAPTLDKSTAEIKPAESGSGENAQIRSLTKKHHGGILIPIAENTVILPYELPPGVEMQFSDGAPLPYSGMPIGLSISSTFSELPFDSQYHVGVHEAGDFVPFKGKHYVPLEVEPFRPYADKNVFQNGDLHHLSHPRYLSAPRRQQFGTTRKDSTLKDSGPDAALFPPSATTHSQIFPLENRIELNSVKGPNDEDQGISRSYRSVASKVVDQIPVESGSWNPREVKQAKTDVWKTTKLVEQNFEVNSPYSRVLRNEEKPKNTSELLLVKPLPPPTHSECIGIGCHRMLSSKRPDIMPEGVARRLGKKHGKLMKRHGMKKMKHKQPPIHQTVVVTPPPVVVVPPPEPIGYVVLSDEWVELSEWPEVPVDAPLVDTPPDYFPHEEIPFPPAVSIPGKVGGFASSVVDEIYYGPTAPQEYDAFTSELAHLSTFNTESVEMAPPQPYGQIRSPSYGEEPASAAERSYVYAPVCYNGGTACHHNLTTY